MIEAGRRADIQALRGIAVLLVVAYHAFPQAVPAGYIGVDLFFVISGWLITGMIITAQDEGRFALAAFWAGRIKRLLPAAYATIALTIAGSWLVLAGKPLVHFGDDVLGALSFTLNWLLPARQNYFAPSAEFSPLLHLWSLSVEEQFYLALPLALMLVPRRARVGLVLAVFVASAGLRWFAWTWASVPESFFLPLTRAWELALGGLGWFAARHIAAPRRWAGAATLGLCAALAIVAAGLIAGKVPASAFHPSRDAVLACGIALALLWLRGDGLWRRPWLMPLIWTGNISYALYLVHWPLFALVRAARYETRLEAPLACALIGLAFLLAALLHVLIERPLHRARLYRPALAFALALAAALPLGVAGWAVSRDAAHYLPDSRDFLEDGCGKAAHFAPRGACRVGARPTTLLWGDSQAAHLRSGLIASAPKARFVQATRAACAPSPGLKERFKGWETRQTARACLAWQASVLRWLDGQPQIRTVILSGSWGAGRAGRGSGDALYRQAADGRLRAMEYDPAQVSQALAALVRQLRASGRRVVLVAPPPVPGFDVGMCEAARAMGKPHALRAGCVIDLRNQAEDRAARAALLSRIEADADASLLRFDPLLCREGHCLTRYAGQPLYHDDGHFSAPGFAPLAREIGLMARLQAMAR